MAYVREDTIEEYWHKEVEQRSGFTYKCTVPGRRNAPDRITMLPKCGVFFVELKAPGKKPNKAQLREHGRILRWSGGKVSVFANKFEIDLFLAEYDAYMISSTTGLH